MEAFIKQFLLYTKLAWHYITYCAHGTEPERFHSNLGRVYFNFGSFQKAIAHFEQSEKTRHSADRSFARYNSYYLGFSLMNVGKYPDAITHFEAYLRLKPSDSYVKEVIGWCQAQQKEDEPYD